jgi:Bacterial membrane protein YfhO
LRLGVTLAAVAALWLVAASRWLFTDSVVPWDSKNQFYAFFRFLASSLAAGDSPFWNPYHYGGHPSVADPQSLIFAPVFLVWAWLDPTPSMRAFDLVVYAHLLIGGLALGAIGWRRGWPPAASILAAAVFMFGGPAAGRLQHTGIILSYAMLPPALLLMSLALQRRSLLLGAAFGGVAAMLLLGRNQEALLLCFVLLAAFVGEMVTASDRRYWLRERKAVLATMGLVTVALVAVPLLLTIQFAALSNRPEVQLDRALESSLYPANLASMAVANVMGSLEATDNYWGPNYERLPEVAATDRSSNYLFVGATTVVLLLWFGLAGGGLLRRGSRLLSAVLVLALLYMLGRYTPLYAWAFEHVPGINLFRRPVDAAFVFVAALAILVGRLLADYVSEGLPRSPPWRQIAVAGAALALIAWAVAFSARWDHGWDAFREVLKAAPIALVVIGSLAWARSARARHLAAACVATVAATELLWWNTASSLNAEPPGYYAVLQNPTGQEAAALAVIEREIEARRAQGERPRVEVVGVGGPWQNLAMTRGLEATNGYNPLRIGWYDRLVSPGETTYMVDQRQFPASFDTYDCALARELGLEFVVLGRPIEEVPHLARRPVADVLLAGPRIWIYRLADPEPRVRFISRVQVANISAEVKAGQFRVNPSAETAVIDHATAPSRNYAALLGNREGDHADIVSWHPDRVEVSVDAVQPGVLVLHEAFYPGWVVEVDGRPAQLLRANVLFRGVEVAEGKHHVVFRFQPFALANLGDAVLTLLQRPR